MTQRVIELYKRLFLQWNQHINLSAARSDDELEEQIEDCRHVVSLLVGASRVIDVGSGGGLPVVVAAIELPSTRFVALEPVHKKHAFLRTAARDLNLTNLEPVAIRVADFEGHDFDIAMSRATFDLAEWLTIGTRLVRVGGKVIGFEGIRREDLDSRVERTSYSIRGKARSLVTLKRLEHEDG